MKNNILKFLFLSALMISVASCQTDDVDNSLGYEVEDITNVELYDALKEMGYTFDENDELVCDDMVKNTTSLDLSNRGLTSIYGLAIFDALTDVDLSFNEFGTSINFREMPESIAKVNLTGNESIETYNGLIMVVSGSVPRENLTKIVFPESVKWNMNEVIAFATSEIGLKADLTICDVDGNSETYSHLRNIPDVYLKIKLRELYPSLFDATTGYIDLSKSIEESEDLVLTEEYSNLEGVEYILSNPSYAGADGRVVLRAKADSPYEMTYVKPALTVVSLSMVNVNTPNGIDLSVATDLTALRISGNSDLTELALPSTFMGSEVSDAHITENELCVEDCSELTSITLPTGATSIGKLQFSNLPKLEELDLTAIQTVHSIVMYDMAATNVAMPSLLTAATDGWGSTPTANSVCIAYDSAFGSTPNLATFKAMCTNAGFSVSDLSGYYFGFEE